MPNISPHDIASAFLSGASGNRAATFSELATLLLQEFDRCGYSIVEKSVNDKILSGPSLDGPELLARLERRMGSMKLVGDRDDLLLDAAVFVARQIKSKSE